MSVLIHGMDMPKTCVGCVLDRGGYCEGFELPRAIKFKTDHITRMDWCPLIELPPHGRLIDADELIKCMIEEKWADRCGWADALDIAAAPTIVPADKDGAE